MWAVSGKPCRQRARGPSVGPVDEAGELQPVGVDRSLLHGCRIKCLSPQGIVTSVNVTFYGVRGSCPCSGDATGATGATPRACVVDIEGDEPLIVDLGTGLRALGDVLQREVRALGTPMRATALLTHLHFDHILGIPFFSPLHDPGARLTVYGPAQPKGSLKDALHAAVQPPVFPIHMEQFRGELDHRRPRGRGLLRRLGQGHGPAHPARRDDARLPDRGRGTVGRLHVRPPGPARPPGHPRGRARAVPGTSTC